MPSIFHYSSNSGTFGIIESQCLWATHYRYLNDFKELQIIRDILKPIFEKDLREEFLRMTTAGLISDKPLKRYGDKLHEMEANNIINKAFLAADELFPMFIASFCKHRSGDDHENGLLSQWRAYGADGGCAVEFDEKALSAYLQKEGKISSYSTAQYDKVIYKDYIKHFDGNTLKGLAAKHLRRLNRANGPTDIPDYEELFMAIVRWAPLFKSPGFKEEKEYRIVVGRTRQLIRESEAVLPLKPIKIRYRSGQPIPYIELFKDLGPLPIKRILIGPQKDQEKVRYALELMLEKAKTSAEISFSGISYVP